MGGKSQSKLWAVLSSWILILAASAQAGSYANAESGPGEDGVYLFAYFKSFWNSSGDGLHLAWSRDGLDWKKLNGGRIYFKPRQGAFRDPFILQGPDGIFHMTWTSQAKSIGYAASRDLVAWTDEKYLPVMKQEPGALNCWAPEMFYDQAKKQFLVFWSTTIPGRFPETDSAGDYQYNHRIYYTTTTDFQTFSPARLFFDPGFNCIDATIIKAGDEYVLFLKNETLKPMKKYIVSAQAKSPEGPFGPVSDPITPSWSEGPSALRIGDQWFLYYDLYAANRYGLSGSEDLKEWRDLSSKLELPGGARHGCGFKISRQIFLKLSPKMK